MSTFFFSLDMLVNSIRLTIIFFAGEPLCPFRKVPSFVAKFICSGCHHHIPALITNALLAENGAENGADQALLR